MNESPQATGMANPLVRKLVIAVLIKLLVLAALWWFFIRDFVVRPESHAVAAHISAPASSTADDTHAINHTEQGRQP